MWSTLIGSNLITMCCCFCNNTDLLNICYYIYIVLTNHYIIPITNALLKICYLSAEDAIEPILTTSRFGKPVIMIGHYRFNKYYKSTGDKARWYCTQISSGCKASIVTIRDEIIKINNQHNHSRLKTIHDFKVI